MMINKIKKILWKEEGMEFSDTPKDSKGLFHLKYKNKLIGYLSFNGDEWIFKYSEEYKRNPIINPIIDFPDKTKEYRNKLLWPFFAARIPAINQPFHHKKIKKAKIKKDNSVALLRLFGNATITNPYRLNAVEEPISP